MRKKNSTYFFSVEGETEKWYLEWLQRTINARHEALYTVKFDCSIQKDPLKRAKGLVVLNKTEVTHIVDRESEESIHVQQFETMLNRMKEAENIGKSIKYNLGYSNFAFELWVVLHKDDCNSSLTHRRQYLSLINNAFSEQFETLSHYKQEANFKRILSKLTLDNVKEAVRRSEFIMRSNQENGYILHQYKGYRYYTENPSLSIWEIIKKILTECGLYK
jgi:hypothetical protein